MKKDPRIYLAHILECATKIEDYITTEKEFLRDPKTQDAVIRNFEIIGEAAKRVPDDYPTRYPDIPWRLMEGFRDVLIHCYEGVDLQRVWKIAKEDLPQVKAAISKILPPLEQLERELVGDNAVHGQEGGET